MTEFTNQPNGMSLDNKSPQVSAQGAPQGVVILGSTGTVGKQTIDVVLANSSEYFVHSLCANKNWQILLEQCRVCQPKYVVIRQTEFYSLLKDAIAALNLSTIVLSGDAGIDEVICHQECVVVMSAIVGAAGLIPTKKAIENGRKVLIANKEPIVMVGELLIDLAAKHNALLLPVDSEHNAIQQCLPMDFRVSIKSNLMSSGVKRLLLTGSGGPFRQRKLESLHDITVEQACNHPNWVMGPKISIDSATMMNKALELIEACYLFNLPEDKIDIVIHPQSIIHSMVEYIDGSLIAQMASSDMKVPIANALAWPKRIVSTATPLDLFSLNELNFYPPDYQRFPVLKIAQYVAREKGFNSVLFNAANEQAVSLFMDGKISFAQIVDVISQAMDSISLDKCCELNIDSAIEFDQEVRQKLISRYS